MGRKFKSQIEAQAPTPAMQLQDQFLRWRKSPKVFFEEGLGVRLTNQQEAACFVLRDMIAAKRRQSEKKPLSSKPKHYFTALKEYTEKELAEAIGISIHSGKGLGKDYWIAGVSCWFLLLFHDFKGLTTAPNSKQLESIYSSEVKKLLRDSPTALWKFIEVVKGGIHLRNGKRRAEAFIEKRTATVKGEAEAQAETLQGMHAPYMAFFIDEASGLPDGCFKALEETLTGYMNLCILITNVTKNTGRAYRTHYDKVEKEHWICLRWNAEESNLDDVTGHSGLSMQIKRMEKKYGRDSNPFRIAVLGLPPLADRNALIPLDQILSAVNRDIEPSEDAPTIMAADVGRGGDCSAIAIRHGDKFLPIETLNVRDTSLVSEWVETTIDERDPDAVGIDVIGIGAGVVDNCRRDGYTVREVNFSVKLTGTQWYNVRAKAYWILRDKFEKGVISIPDDDELIYELSTIRVQDWEPQILLVSKKKMLSEGKKSPNRADAVAETYAIHSAGYERQKEEERDAYRDGNKEKNPQTSWMAA